MDLRDNEAFTQLLRNAVAQAEKLGYKPNQFKRMLEQHGGFETVQRVLATGKPSDGFTRLWELKRLDLTCEALIVETEWRKHFDATLIARAEGLLTQMGYAFKPFSVPDVGEPAEPDGAKDQAGNPDQDPATSAGEMRINAFFRDMLFAPVRNERWSWGAVDEARRHVFLRLWNDDILEREDARWIRVLGQNRDNRNGWSEREHHLGLIEKGYTAYAVMCEKSVGTGRRIEHFDQRTLIQLTDASEINDDRYMRLGGHVSIAMFSAPRDNAVALQQDLDELQVEGNGSTSTTRSTLVDARLGQGRYRSDLMRVWDGSCAVTGCCVAALLRASHCKPWRDSDNQERLDPHNGLMLTANLDALFDARLISFDEDGAMLVSAAITEEEREALGLPAPLRRRPGPELGGYLRHHRERFDLLAGVAR